MRDPALTYYTAADGVLPSAARAPWVSTGSGGTLTGGRLRITGTAAANHYTRTLGGASGDDRLEVQAEFQRASDTPVWDGPGNVLWIDDGERALGVGLGSTLSLIDPATGDILVTPDADVQPGGASTLRSYHLIKLGRARWELWVDGALVLVWPYEGGALRSGGDTVFGFGYADPGGTGTASWDRVETGVNEALVPHAKFDRVRYSAPKPLQDVWDGAGDVHHNRHTALWRGAVGLAHATQDRMQRLWGDFTADTVVVDSASFDGTTLPGSPWALVGSTGDVEVVRQRVRIDSTTTTTYAEWEPTVPAVLDTADTRRSWVWAARAAFRVVELTSTQPNGRLGPYVAIFDGAFRVGAYLVRDLSNPQQIGWVLSDADMGGALTNRGEVHHLVDPYGDSVVELFVVGDDRVVLFVNGEIVEDTPYSQFNGGVTTDLAIRIGREGSATVSCVVDVEDVLATVAHADLSYRPLFQRRVAERLIFASGCERNDRLEVWLRHRAGVFEARGTSRVLSEIRRVACDDDAALVVERQPADWYLDVTYPEVTPVFLDTGEFVTSVGAEYVVDDAPNFTPTQLQELITRYLLPQSTTESLFTAFTVARLTGAASSGGGGTQLPVNATTGFAMGDSVSLRDVTSGTLMTIGYDSDEGLTDLLASQVRDFSGNDRTGTLTGANASILNLSNYDAAIVPTNANTGSTEGVRTASLSPSLSGGFTVAARMHIGATHSTDWYIAKTTSGIGTGGFEFFWANTGNLLTGRIFDGAGGKSVTIADNSTTGTSNWYALRWDDTANLLSIWLNGVKVAESTNTAFTMLDPGATVIGFGAQETGGSGKWRGRQRDQILYTRTLTDLEMAALYADETGRATIRRDASVFVAYLPAGYPVILATHDDATPPLAADYMQLSANLGRVWADWGFRALGQAGAEIVGSVTLPGLDSHKLANITGGATLRFVGAGAGVDCWVTAFGVDSGSGNPVSERVRVVGTTPVTGTVTWGASGVYGVIADRNVQADVSVQDSTGPTTLYTIPSGSRSRGCHLFTTPLHAGPQKVTVVADGASTAKMQVWGVEEADVYTGETYTLAGTTPVAGTVVFASVNVFPMGYVAAARAVTATGGFVDPAGSLTVVSDSSSDTQALTLFSVSTMGEAAMTRVDVDGTSPASIVVTFPQGDLHRVLGLKLSETAVGNVTVTLDNPAAPSDVLVGTFSAGEISLGMDLRRIANAGDVTVEPSAVSTTTRWVGIYGRDATGTEVFSVVRPSTASARASVSTEAVEVLGVAMGDFSNASICHWRGVAWRYPHASDVFRRLGSLRGWTLAGPGSGAIVFDGALDDVASTDVTLASLAMTGTWSSNETSEVIAVADTVLTVSTVTGTYGSGDVVRRVV